MRRPEYAGSTKWVRPTVTVPSFLNRSPPLESRAAAGVPTSTFEPPSVVTPASSNRSLIEIGMPASAGSFAPPRRCASTWSAAASDSLSCTLRKVREPSPCGSLIAASACSTSWRLVIPCWQGVGKVRRWSSCRVHVLAHLVREQARCAKALRWQEQTRPGGQCPAKSFDALDPCLFLLVVKIFVRKEADHACRRRGRRPTPSPAA